MAMVPGRRRHTPRPSATTESGISRASCRSSWHIVVWCARRDGRESLEALREVEDQPAKRAPRPAGPGGAEVGLLLGILDQIEEVGCFEHTLFVVGLGLPDKMHLPLAPLHGAKLAGVVVDA